MIVDNGKFYIYRHITLCGTVFYIGKGSKKEKEILDNIYTRAFKKDSRNKYWKHTANKYGYFVEIMIESNNEEFIFEKEKEFIKLYGRKDLNLGTLVNMTDGGEGPLGYIPTKETLEKMRTCNIGKKMPESFSKQTSLRMKGNKYRLNKPNFKETNINNGKLHMKKVYSYDLEGNFVREFESLKETAIFFNRHSTTITMCISKKIKQINGFQLSFLKTNKIESVFYKLKRKGKIKHLNILTNEEKIFNSIKETSSFLNINSSKIRHNLYGESKIVEKINKFSYYE